MRIALLAALLTAYLAPLAAQTTQGLIVGRVTDANTGLPLTGASISCRGEGELVRSATPDRSGYYRFTFLSPGIYRIRVTAPKYQSQTIYNIAIEVAGRLDLDFSLRSLQYVFDSGNYRQLSLPNSKSVLPYFGPDVDPSRSGVIQPETGNPSVLESSVSEVIGRALLDTLPLAGRDAYALLITQPGVTADTTTARGLGLSVNGQRPSSSNYLLDGLDNNNHLTTGPLAATSPDTIEEYRLSTNNFSAEYGGSTGFIANTISRAGTPSLHGLGYLYVGNELLNANGFQENANGIPRSPFKSLEGGFLIAGPLVRVRLFGSLSTDLIRLRDETDPLPFVLPTAALLTSMKVNEPNSSTTRLMQEYPAVTVPQSSSTQFGCKPQKADFACAAIRPRDSRDSLLIVPRLDANTRASDHWFARVAFSRDADQPAFLYTPYPAFLTTITSNESAAGAGWTGLLSSNLTASIRAGWAATTFLLPRTQDAVPNFSVSDSALLTVSPKLPGNPLPYSARNLERRPELAADLIWARGPHVVKIGGGFLTRYIENQLEDENAGFLTFRSLQQFVESQPVQLELGVSRQDHSAEPLNNRRYIDTQWSGYIQDTVKVTRRLGLNFGIRLERFGYPRNTGGSPDATLLFGPGADPNTRIQTASLVYGTAPFYRSLPLDWGPRIGAAWRLDARGDLVARAAWGIFYDEPFDNLWENGSQNSLQTGTLAFPAGYSWTNQPPRSLVSALGPADVSRSNNGLSAFDPAFHSGLVQSYLAALEKRFSPSLSLEIDGLGSSGDGLITNNILNRNDDRPLIIVARSNPAIPQVSYRGNQGYSSYHALAAVLRYRDPRRLLQLSYTWSRSIDNQSEALAGGYDLSFALGPSGSLNSPVQDATFVQTVPSRADRGDSDFDQRQNLVGFGSVALPSNWRISWLGAVRSGLPFTVTGVSGSNVLDQHADLVDPAAARIDIPGTNPGTRILLNPAAFRQPATGTVGNSGRNSFRSPGFYSVDASLSRSFHLPRTAEAMRATLRLDALNLLNHTNLNAPANSIFFPNFGTAQYGLAESDRIGIAGSSPLDEAGRQLRLVLRISF